MVKVAIIGVGKMGISHLAILGANPNVQVVGVCDTSKFVTDALSKYGKFDCFSNYQEMLDETQPEAVVIAVPTKFHTDIVKDCIIRNLHIFVEKPFSMNPFESSELLNLLKGKNLINQVGYHNKFIGTFAEVKKIIEGGYIGNIVHFHGQSYGPVIIRIKQDSWRTQANEGGGCLMDYASHVIDLINYLISPINKVYSSELKKIYSKEVDDAVYAMVSTDAGINGMISVNWSDETYRKMSTSITIVGEKGKIISDANECKIYLKDQMLPNGYNRGWNIKYVTELNPQVNYYLRGEEYSAQLDYFVSCISENKPNKINSFESATQTDNAISIIRQKSI